MRISQKYRRALTILKKHIDLIGEGVLRSELIDMYNDFTARTEPYFKEWMDRANYIAMCEGDDYWTHPSKLQIQVDFLESHPDYSCAFHRYEIYNETTKELFLAPNKYYDDFKHKDEAFFEFNNEYNLLIQWTSKILTIMYRKELNNQNLLSKFNYYRDVHLVYYLLNNGKGACFSFIGGVLKLMYYRYSDSFQYITLSGLSLIVFKIKRKIRLHLTKKERNTLVNNIIPQF